MVKGGLLPAILGRRAWRENDKLAACPEPFSGAGPAGWWIRKADGPCRRTEFATSPSHAGAPWRCAGEILHATVELLAPGVPQRDARGCGWPGGVVGQATRLF